MRSVQHGLPAKEGILVKSHCLLWRTLTLVGALQPWFEESLCILQMLVGRAFCSTQVACQGRHPCQVVLYFVENSDAGWSFATLVRRESLYPSGADARRAFCSTWVACQGRHPCQVVLSSVDDSDAGWTRVCCILQLMGDVRSVQHGPPAKERILVESPRLLSSVDDSDAGSTPSGDLLKPREDTPTNQPRTMKHQSCRERERGREGPSTERRTRGPTRYPRWCSPRAIKLIHPISNDYMNNQESHQRHGHFVDRGAAATLVILQTLVQSASIWWKTEGVN